MKITKDKILINSFVINSIDLGQLPLAGTMAVIVNNSSDKGAQNR